MEKKVAKVKMRISRAGIWNRGYTLIELTIILILLGIILSFALPKLEKLGEAKLRTATRKLAGTIETLFDEAVLKKKPYKILFDLNKKKYSIISYKENNTQTENDEFQQLEEEDLLREVYFADGIYIKDIFTPMDGLASDGYAAIQFYPDGYVERSIIHISDGRKDYTLLTVPLTGKVKVFKGYVEISFYEEE